MKSIARVVHQPSVVQSEFYEATRILFVCKENKNNNFFSTIRLLITVAPFLRFCTERKHCTLFCIHLNKDVLFSFNQCVHTHRIRILALRRILNMLMFHVDVNMKLLGIRFKNDLFQCFRVESLFWETIALYTVHFQIEHFAGCFHSLELLHTAWKVIFKNP